MPVQSLKSIHDPAAPATDGLRILATRFWPRGVPRSAADLYLPDLAPSKELLSAFKAGDIAWAAFRRRYVAEMKGQTSLLRTLAWLDRRGETMTVMCVCGDPARCHRTVLAELIGKA